MSDFTTPAYLCARSLEASSGNQIPPDAAIVLNISGGGRKRMAAGTVLFSKAADATLHATDWMAQGNLDRICAIFN